MPRNDDGSYDAQKVLAHAIHKAPKPVFDDDMQETFLQAAEVVFCEEVLSHKLLELLETLDDEYGDAALAAIVRKGIQQAHDFYVFDDNPPDLSEKAIREEVAEDIEDHVRRRYSEERKRELQAVHVCDHCKKIRRGHKWAKGNVPREKEVFGDICPTCLDKGLE